MIFNRCYSELIKIPTFEERFDYLKTNGQVGEETFGSHRYLNQKFYTSDEWLRIRNYVIARDLGCDLGIKEREIFGLIIVHHMNPITMDDILEHSDRLVNPDFLICTSKQTHLAIHYGDKSLLIPDLVERRPNDTCPWKS